MGTLNPQIGGIGVSGPVQQSPDAGLVGISRALDFLSAGLGGHSSDTKLTEADKFGAAFKPFQDKIIDITKSELDPVEKKRRTSEILVQASLALPQYASRIKAVGANLGISPPEIVDPQESYKKAVMAWAQTDGAVFIPQSTVYNKDGSVDHEATLANLAAKYQEEQALEQRRLALKRQAEISGTEDEIFKQKAETYATDVANKYTSVATESLGNLSNLLNLPNAQTVPELKGIKEAIQTNNHAAFMGILRNYKAVLSNRMRQELVKAGVPIDIVNEKVAEFEKTFDPVLKAGEAKVTDVESYLKILQASAEAKVTDQLSKKFGPLGGTRSFVKTAGEVAATNEYPELKKFVKESAQGDIPSYDKEYDSVVSPTEVVGSPVKQQPGGDPAKGAISASEAIAKTNINDQQDVADVPDLLTTLNSYVYKANSPLSPDAAKQVMNPRTYSIIQDLAKRNDSIGRKTAIAFAHLVDSQITRLWQFIDKSKAVEVVKQPDGSLSLRITGQIDTKGYAVQDMKRAVEAINYWIKIANGVDNPLVKQALELSLVNNGIVKPEAPKIKVNEKRVQQFLSDPGVQRGLASSSSIIGIPQEDVLRIIAFETANTFNTKVSSEATSAVGLFQITKAAAKDLGVDHSQIKNMSPEEQIILGAKYIKKNLDRAGIKDPTIVDAYLALHYPAALGKGQDFVLYGKGSKEYELNRGLDANKDGYVTVGDVAAVISGVETPPVVLPTIQQDNITAPEGADVEAAVAELTQRQAATVQSAGNAPTEETVKTKGETTKPVEELKAASKVSFREQLKQLQNQPLTQEDIKKLEEFLKNVQTK